MIARASVTAVSCTTATTSKLYFAYSWTLIISSSELDKKVILSDLGTADMGLYIKHMAQVVFLYDLCFRCICALRIG